MDTRQVAQRLVELCRQGKNDEAKAELYSPDIVSIEAFAPPGMSAESRGLEASRRKGEWWVQHNDVHAANARGPYVLGDRFAVVYHYDLTPKTGPDGGKRTTMEEVAVYTVKNGKIVHEEFMY